MVSRVVRLCPITADVFSAFVRFGFVFVVCLFGPGLHRLLVCVFGFLHSISSAGFPTMLRLSLWLCFQPPYVFFRFVQRSTFMLFPRASCVLFLVLVMARVVVTRACPTPVLSEMVVATLQMGRITQMGILISSYSTTHDVAYYLIVDYFNML